MRRGEKRMGVESIVLSVPAVAKVIKFNLWCDGTMWGALIQTKKKNSDFDLKKKKNKIK